MPGTDWFFCTTDILSVAILSNPLATGLVNNLGVLAFFKYSPFFVENLNGLLAWSGAGYSLEWPAVLLPVGISFFTFQSMSYTIDYYRNDVDYEPSLVRYATFVSFFPQLVAVANLLRLQRLYGHGSRHRPGHGFRPDAEFLQSVSRHQPPRLRVALAHQPLDVVSRLRLHPARWQLGRSLVDLSQPIFLTMVISGFWHGAAWTFLIWGALHGAAYVLMRALENARWYRERVPTVVKQVGIFTFVCLTWVFFRASSVADAWLILTRIATGAWTDPRFPLLAVVLLAMVVAYQWLFENVQLPRRASACLQGLLLVAILLYISFVPGRSNQPFIYFQF